MGAALDLEPLNGGLGSRSEQSVERTGVNPEATQHALYLENLLRAARTAITGTRTKRRWGATLRQGRGLERG
jgi:hypothetical protein